ncbi:MAG: hypothetical protein P1V97_25285 [Planctomycetota bacterium]|nr:hypothetical protein [Planctomycetota bacterium]
MKTLRTRGPKAALCLVAFSFAACGGTPPQSANGQLTATVTPTSTTPAPTPPTTNTALATPAPTPTPATSNFSVSRATLSTGKLYVPARYAPTQDIDIMIHFHGLDSVVEREFDEAKIESALVVVNYNGFSSVYSGPFSDPLKLERILDEAVLEVGAARNVSQPRMGKLIVSAFSAGYGATREILKSGRYDSMISDVLLLDGLHSGYVSGNQPNPIQMKPFLDFATKATRGLDHRMIISHSSIVPPNYASTTETADYLVAQVGAVSNPETGLNVAGMRNLRSVDLGHFHIYGFKGGVASDHVDHLQQMGLWMKDLSLAR